MSQQFLFWVVDSSIIPSNFSLPVHDSKNSTLNWVLKLSHHLIEKMLKLSNYFLHAFPMKKPFKYWNLGMKLSSFCCNCLLVHIYIHTHTYIYIYFQKKYQITTWNVSTFAVFFPSYWYTININFLLTWNLLAHLNFRKNASSSEL